MTDKKLNTPLHYAVGKKNNHIAELLIKKAANINSHGQGGLTPLHFASLVSNIKAITFLISSGANINALDYGMYTPLDCTESVEVQNIIRSYGGRTAEKERQDAARERLAVLEKIETESTIDDLQAKVDELEYELANKDSDIDDLQSDRDDLSSRIDDLEQKPDEYKPNLYDTMPKIRRHRKLGR